MKIVFMGTPDFSAIVLEKLNSVYPVSAVVTGHDKPVGRGHILKASPLKEKALELNIPVLQYSKVSREGIEDIKALKPDIIVTAAFGQILSEEFLAIPKFGVLNVHASLLPKYRGASPIQWAILNGDEKTGVTIMRTVKAVDAGDILLAKSVKIGENETAGGLFDRLAVLGGEAIIEAVQLFEEGKAVFVPQDDSKATHCGMISKENGLIDFSQTAHQLDCFVRGMTPWPSAYTHLGDKVLKVFAIERVAERNSGVGYDSASNKSSECDENYDFQHHCSFGNVVCANAANGLIVQAGDGLLRLKEIQLEGARRMTDIEFLRGRSVPAGTVLK